MFTFFVSYSFDMASSTPNVKRNVFHLNEIKIPKDLALDKKKKGYLISNDSGNFSILKNSN